MQALELTDTHCHVHEASPLADEDRMHEMWTRLVDHDPDSLLSQASEQGITRIICVGTTLNNSAIAVDFASKRPTCWSSIGIHPHEAKDYVGHSDKLAQFAALTSKPKVVAVGECGLDYYYNHSPKSDQLDILRFQIELALKHDLPLIFHVRDAFDDFWPVFDSYKGVRGVIHSFTASKSELDRSLERGLYIGLNGIMTFTKDDQQLLAAKAVPLDRLLLETDAPFLAPKPYRGKICEPAFLKATAEFLADLRGESCTQLAQASTANAIKLFSLN